MQTMRDASCLMDGSSGLVAKAAESLIERLKEQDRVSDCGLQYLGHCYAQAEAPWIDYDKYAADFAYGYFIQNYWKASLAFRCRKPGLATRVLDVGCGSGAASIAYLAYLDDFLEYHIDVSVCLLDRSAAQLSLAREMLAATVKGLSKITVHADFQHSDILDWPAGSRFDLVLHGHVLTENRDTVSTILRNSVDVTAEDGRLYTLEREHDKVWKEIENAAEELAFGVQVESTRPMLSTMTEDICAYTGEGSLVTNYLVLRNPERPELRELLRLYFHAWKYQDSGILERVFTSDAEYLEKPFAAPLIGIDEIRRYWSEKVERQRALSVRLGHVSYVNNEAVAEWRARFVLGGVDVSVRGTLILRLDPYSGKIISLREYFRSAHR